MLQSTEENRSGSGYACQMFNFVFTKKEKLQILWPIFLIKQVNICFSFSRKVWFQYQKNVNKNFKIKLLCTSLGIQPLPQNRQFNH